jgi:hypothetical protein
VLACQGKKANEEVKKGWQRSRSKDNRGALNGKGKKKKRKKRVGVKVSEAGRSEDEWKGGMR